MLNINNELNHICSKCTAELGAYIFDLNVKADVEYEPL